MRGTSVGLRTLAAAGLLAAAGGCRTFHPVDSDAAKTPARQTSRFLTASDIERSGAENAWEALRRLGHVRLEEDSNGSPSRISPTRGHGSIILDDSPIIVLDGVRVVDFGVLRMVPANTIASIEFENAVDGTLHHGTGAVGGAIVIVTRTN